MIVRNPFTATVDRTYRGAAVSLGQLATDPRVILEHLHGLAVAIYDAQRRAQTNPVIEVQNVRNLLAQFQVTAQRFLAASEAADPTQLGALDRFILATGTWIEQSMKALPGVVSAIPRTLVDAIGITGWSVVKNVVPLVLLAALVFYGVQSAEKTRTYTRYVA
jgi:hypothetical protein